MGWFSSKTETHVSSSTSPMFDMKKRVDNFQAALIDHTSSLSMEQSEYLRAHYNASRLKNFWGLLNWAEKSEFNKHLGKITSDFYGDAKFDNTVVTEALRPLITIPSFSDFQVYQTSLAFFSEDFCIRHIASLQGKAHYFYTEVAVDYTIDYPTEGEIRAVFKDGREIIGKLPEYGIDTRFLEIKYSVTVKEETAEGISTYLYDYGFYQYKEGSGSKVLDDLIKNNGVQASKTFYPVIPLRNWTAWHSGEKAKHINDALVHLQLYDPKEKKENAYSSLIKNCEEGMKSGSIRDIDHITLILGVTLNTRNQADLRYLFEFFFNCYTNYAIATGQIPQSFIGGKPLYGNRGNLNELHKKTIEAIQKGREDSYYSQFSLHNGNSNFNYRYGWLASDYYEANGTFKPDAKVGEYGVLAGEYNYTYQYQEWYRTGNEEEGYKWKVRWKTVSADYNLTCFCYQSSKSRWKCVAFVDLVQVNHVYAGKGITTDAFYAVRDSGATQTISHDFSGDYDGKYESWKILHFKYVENTGEDPSAFIVPLEQNTLYECGQKVALDISYGCYFLVFNCWIQVKKKWYQNGFFGAIISFVGIVLSYIFPYFAPLILLVTGVFIVNTVLTLLQKVLSLVFGDRWATRIVDFALQIIKGIVSFIGSIAFKIPVIGWLVWGVCVAIQFNLTAGEILWKGGTLKQALVGGAKAAVISAISTAVAGQILGPASGGNSLNSSLTFEAAKEQIVSAGSAMTVGQLIAMSTSQSFIEGSLGSLFDGKSLGSSLKTGFKAGAISGAVAYLNVLANKFGLSNSLKGSTLDFSEFQSFGLMDWAKFAGNMFMNNLVNINTFANLMQMTLEEREFHKMANLENDFQEFNNKMAAANKVLNQLAESVSGTTTAESVCRMQACLGKALTQYPDTVHSMSTDTVLALGVLSGSDMCKTVLGNIDCWCDSQLTMDGYQPSDLHYSTFSNTLTWDANLRTGT